MTHKRKLRKTQSTVTKKNNNNYNKKSQMKLHAVSHVQYEWRVKRKRSKNKKKILK